MRQLFKNIIIVLIMIAAFMMNVSCPQNGTINFFVGVGAEVDQKPPEISITSHSNGDYLHHRDMMIGGIFKDNVGVTKVVVVLEVQNSGQTLKKECNCDNAANGIWQVTFLQSDMEHINVFDINDNETKRVIFTATAFDAMNNIQSDSLFLYVDNVDPVVEWQKPISTDRFDSNGYALYVNGEFDNVYPVSDPTHISKFHNGNIILSGFVKDNYTVAYTYIRFRDPSNSNKDTNIVAVTPIIGTVPRSDDFSLYEMPTPDKDIAANPSVKMIGSSLEDATPMSWRFNIDTTELTNGTDWFKVEIITADEAGNFTPYDAERQYLCIKKDADVPQNKFNFAADYIINVGGMVSGIAFDDDGVKEIYVAAVPVSMADTVSSLSPKDWSTLETDENKKTVITKYVQSPDMVNGSSSLAWSMGVPEKGGDYVLFVAPYDINNLYPHDYYRITFSVAREDDPKIIIDDKYHIVTIIEDDQFIEDGGYWITGHFYDDETIDQIKVMMGWNVKEWNDASADTYYIFNKENDVSIWSETFKKDKEDEVVLKNGQTAARYWFKWRFNPSLFGKEMTYNHIQLKFVIIDNNNKQGNDMIDIYGDSERPIVVVEDPSSDAPITADKIFRGYIEDNVDLKELLIECESSGLTQDSNFPRRWTLGSESSDITSDITVDAVSWKTDKGKYRREFQTLIKPSDISYKAATFTFKVTDKSGNYYDTTLYIKEDTAAPEVSIVGLEQNDYIGQNGSFYVVVKRHSYDEGQYRDVNTISMRVGDYAADWTMSKDNHDGWDLSGDVYSRKFNLKDMVDDAGHELKEGNVIVNVTAADVAGIEGSKSIYFIYDKTAPSEMEITSPSLLDKSGIIDLTNDPNGIDMVKIAYYLNNSVIFRGIGNDAGKIKNTTISIYDMTNDQQYSIIIDNSSDVMSWKALKRDGTDWEGVANVQGLPSNYSFTMDTTKMPDGCYYIKIRSADVVDNSADAYTKETDKRYFKVMQAADKPRVTFFNSDNDKAFNNYKIKGMAFDDDGFSAGKKFRYVLGCNIQESDMQDAWEKQKNNRKVTYGEFAPDDNVNKFTFEIPDACSDDGVWTLWLQPRDKNDTTGDMFTLTLIVASSEMPIAEEIYADETADGVRGEKYRDTYSGNVQISVKAYSGADKKKVSEIWYRVYASQSEARANDNLTDDIANIDTSHIRGKWYIHTIETSLQQSRIIDKIKFNTKNFCADGKKETLIIEAKVKNNEKEDTMSAANICVIDADYEKPSIKISYPSVDATVDAAVTISGTLNDATWIKNVYISYYDKQWGDETRDISLSGDGIDDLTTANIIPNGGVLEKDKWYDLGAINETSWSHQYKSSLLSDNSKRTLLVVAVDELNNIGMDCVDVNVSFDNDRPIVTISNMKLSNKQGLNQVLKSRTNYIANTQGQIIGSVYDDDGIVQSIEYSEDGENYLPFDNSGNKMSFAFDALEDGTHDLYLRITDYVGSQFVSMPKGLLPSKYPTSIKLSDGTNLFGEKNSFETAGDDADTVIYVKVDTAPPVISDVKFCVNDSESFDPNDLTTDVTDDVYGLNKIIIGGKKYRYLHLKFNATDTNGIEYAKYKLGIGSLETANNNGDNIYYATIDLQNMQSGSSTLELEVRDNVGKTANSKFSVKEIDNERPTVTLVLTNIIVNKTITLSGTVSDANAGIDKVYVSYIRDLNVSGLESSFTADKINDGINIVNNKWNEIKPKSQVQNVADWTGISNWSVDFDTTRITQECQEHFLVAIAAVDKNGNVSFATQEVTIDQDSDRPTVKLLSLTLKADMAENNRTSVNAKTISGIVTDDDGGVKEIKIQTGLDGIPTIITNNNSFDYQLRDGDCDIYITITDNVGGVFSAVVPNSGYDKYKNIILKDSADTIWGTTNEKKDTVLYLNVDTAPAKIEREMYSFADDENYKLMTNNENLKNEVLGGTEKRYLYIKFDATDDNGIPSEKRYAPYILMDNDETFDCTFIGTNEQRCGTYTARLDFSGGRAYSRRSFTIMVMDNAAVSTGIWQRSEHYVQVDNKCPVISYFSPMSGSELYGTKDDNEITGSVADDSGCGSIKIGFSKNDTPPSDWEVVSQYLISDSSAADNPWTLIFNDKQLEQTEKSGVYNCYKYVNLKGDTGLVGDALINKNIDDSQSLYVWMKAADVLGNESEPANGKLALKILANGNKPQIAITYPSDASSDKVLGGTIRISGWSKVATSSVDSIWLQIDPYGDNTPFSNGWKNRLETQLGKHADFTDYAVEKIRVNNKDVTVDGVNPAYGIKVSGDNVMSWGMPINASQEFDEDIDNLKLAVRAYAIEFEEGKASAASNMIKFEIDKNAPVISESKLVSSDGQKQKAYKEGVWIDGENKSWNIQFKVTDNTGIKSISMTRRFNTISNTNELMKEENGNYVPKTEYESWMENIGSNNWIVRIPIDRGDDSGYGTVSYEITAEEIGEGKTTSATYIVRYDTDVPKLTVNGLSLDSNEIRNKVSNGTDSFYSFRGTLSEKGSGSAEQSGFGRVAVFFTTNDGSSLIDPMMSKGQDGTANRISRGDLTDLSEEFGLWAYKIDDVTIDNTTIILQANANEHIRPGGLCIVNDVLYRITSVSGKYIYVEESLGNEGGATVYFPIAQVIDNMTQEYVNDPSELPQTFIVGDDPIRNQDGDQMLESITESDGLYEWNATINTKNLHDGPVKIWFVAFDNAGNMSDGFKVDDTDRQKSIPAAVKNNQLRLAGIKFGSDLDGIESVADTEIDKTFSTIYDKGLMNEDPVTSISLKKSDADFVIKGDVRIIARVVGGNDGIDYTLKIDGINVSSGELASSGFYDDAVHELSINVPYYVLYEKLSNRSNTTMELILKDRTKGQSNTAVYIFDQNVHLNIKDKTPPEIYVKPLYWESISENSIYKDNVNGEVRLYGHIDLSGDLDFVGSQFTNDDGEMDKDSKVSGIIVLEGTASDNSVVNKMSISGITSPAITLTKDTGSFEVNAETGNLASGGWKFVTTSNEIDADGKNIVKWKLYWDTSKINANHVQNDVTITFTVYDKGQSFYDGVEDVPSPKSTSFDDRVDVVPYITTVVTSLSSVNDKTPTLYSRTALGHYPVNGGKPSNASSSTATAETVTFKGFNLGSSVTFTPTATGKYDFKVGEIKCLNNYNNNASGLTDSDSADTIGGRYYLNEAAEVSIGNCGSIGYNRQPNDKNNQLLDDDVYFDVWQFNTKAAVAEKNGLIEQPIMKINPVTNKVGFAFASGPTMFSMGGSKSVGNYSYSKWVGNWDSFTSVGFAYDSAGHSYGCAAGEDLNTDKVDKFIFVSSRIGVSGTGTGTINNGTNMKRLEYIGQMINGSKVVNKQRIRSPSFATSVLDAGTDIESANVYMAYYDDINEEIRFKYGNTLGVAKSRNTKFNATEYMKWYYSAVYKGSLTGDNAKRKFVLGSTTANWFQKSTKVTINGSEYTVSGCNTGTTGAANASNNNCILSLKEKNTADKMNEFVQSLVLSKLRDNTDDKSVTEDVVYAQVMEDASNDGKSYWDNGWKDAAIPGTNKKIKDVLDSIIVYGTGYEKSYENLADYASSRDAQTYSLKYVSLIAGGTTGRTAGEYVSIGVVPKGLNGLADDVVVIVWYDGNTLWYGYNDTPRTNRAETSDGAGWTVSRVFSYENKAGAYCKLIVDNDGGIHIACYDLKNSDLYYAYASSHLASSFDTCIVDSNGSTGSHLTIDVAKVNSNWVPYIGYYTLNCLHPKLAWKVDTSAAAPHGAENNMFTAKWESSIVPTPSTLQMNSKQHNDISVGLWKDASGVRKNSTDTACSTVSETNTDIYGNGSAYPILGYAIKVTSSMDYIETAQMK